MSYNITNFKVKGLHQLKIPASVIDKRGDLKILLLNIQDKHVVIHLGCEEGKIEGYIEDEYLHCTDFIMMGEGSGHDYLDVLKPLLESSVGYLKAIMVWENGDSIVKFEVNNGQISEKEVSDEL